MPALFAYECSGCATNRTACAGRALAAISSFGAPLNKARLSIAGKGRDLTGSARDLLNRTADLEASWSITMLDGNRIAHGAPFLISAAWVMVVMYRTLNAVYLFGDEFASLADATLPEKAFLAELANAMGDGLGYATEIADPSDAAAYAQDVRIFNSENISAALLETRPRWRDYLSQSKSDAGPRNVFSLNIWPTSLLQKIERDALVDLRASARELTSLTPNMTAITMAENDLAGIRRRLASRLFEKPRTTHNRYLN
jgi:hypothetical protein